MILTRNSRSNSVIPPLPAIKALRRDVENLIRSGSGRSFRADVAGLQKKNWSSGHYGNAHEALPLMPLLLILKTLNAARLLAGTMNRSVILLEAR